MYRKRISTKAGRIYARNRPVMDSIKLQQRSTNRLRKAFGLHSELSADGKTISPITDAGVIRRLSGLVSVCTKWPANLVYTNPVALEVHLLVDGCQNCRNNYGIN